MNAKENMHEVRFPYIYILSHIINFIVPLTIIIALAIKAVGFSKVRQTLSTKFAMHYGDIKDERWFFFYLDFLLFQIKKIVTSWF